MQAGDPAPYMDLLSAVADRKFAGDASRALIGPGITRAVIRERDRAPLDGTLPGDGYRLMVEILVERGSRARIETWRLDIRRVPTETNEDEWRIAGQQSLTSVDGLYRLALNPSRAYRARNLVVRSDDLEIRLPDGYVFTADTPDGPTAAVLVAGDGATMSFRPAPETEREQVRIYAGSDGIETRIEDVFLRFSPSDFQARLPADALTEAAPDPGLFRRAEAVFREEVSRSFSLDLGDLSRETWSLPPTSGDFLAEIRTRRFQTLTYSKSANDPEDISVFDRRRRRNISVYPSAARLAAGVSRFDEDARAPFDVTHYDLDVAFDPARQWLDGRALVRLTVRADAINNLTLRLAENLTVRSIYSTEFGRLLSLQIRGQNNVIVNLNGYATRGTPITLDVTYSGRLEPTEPDRESVAPQFPSDQPQIVDSQSFPGEPSLLYSTRTFWYPQGYSGDYATAVMHLSVPEMYQVVASGELAAGSPVVVPGHDRQPSGRRYIFEARQPVRYLACLISRLVRVSARTLSLVEPLSALASSGAGGDAGRAPPCRLVQQPAGSRRRSEPEAGGAGPPGRRGGGRRGGVLHVDHRRFALSRPDARPHREGSAGRPQPGVPRGAVPAAADGLVELVGRPGGVHLVPRVLHRPRNGPPVVGPGGGLADLSRPVDQRGLLAVLRGALRPPAPGRRPVRRHDPAHGEMGPRSGQGGAGVARLPPRAHPGRQPHLQGDRLQQVGGRAPHAPPDDRRRGVLPGRPPTLFRRRVSPRPAPTMCGRPSRRRAAGTSRVSSTPGSTDRARRRWRLRGPRRPAARSGRWRCGWSSAARTANSPSP